MLGYIVRRVLLIIPVVWGAMTLLFFAFLVPGNPVDNLVPDRSASPTIRAQITAKYGLDETSPQRYGHSLKSGQNGVLVLSYKHGVAGTVIPKPTAPHRGGT